MTYDSSKVSSALMPSSTGRSPLPRSSSPPFPKDPEATGAPINISVCIYHTFVRLHNVTSAAFFKWQKEERGECEGMSPGAVVQAEQTRHFLFLIVPPPLPLIGIKFGVLFYMKRTPGFFPSFHLHDN